MVEEAPVFCSPGMLCVTCLGVSPVDRLLFVINAIKEEIVTRVKDCSPQATNMANTLDRLVQETLGESPGTWWCVKTLH